MECEWKHIQEACLEAAKETLGYKKANGKKDIPEIQALSDKQKKIGADINSIKNNKEKRKSLTKERNKIMKEIKKRIKEEDNKEIEETIKEIENSKDDSRRMYKALNKLKATEPRKNILVQWKNYKQ